MTHIPVAEVEVARLVPQNLLGGRLGWRIGRTKTHDFVMEYHGSYPAPVFQP